MSLQGGLEEGIGIFVYLPVSLKRPLALRVTCSGWLQVFGLGPSSFRPRALGDSG